MITAIEIENFKGIGKRQRIEFRPITLLFGPNSAGKSTILHAIHYAREVLERRNLDADHTTGGGPFVDLGGFRSFVHNHAPDEPVTIAFELRRDNPSEILIPQLGQWQAYEGVSGAVTQRLYAANTSRVEFSIRWSPYLNRPFVSRYAVWIDGHSIAVIEADSDKDRPRLTRLNLDHPLFGPGAEGEMDEEAEAVSRIWQWAPLVPTPGEEKPIRAWSLLEPSAMPDLDDELIFEKNEPAAGDDELDATRFLATMNLLSWLLVGPGQLLRDELASLRYIGPLRQTPPRHFEPPLTPEPERWATGLAAWDLLKTAEDQFVEEVSTWLLDDAKLDTGYALRRQRNAELDLASPLAIQLMSPRAASDIEDLAAEIRALPQRTRLTLVDKENPKLCVEPDDVGEGVAQIVPVVVAALDRKCRLLAIEQPELHVHPRVQVALGDLFIHRTTAGRKRVPIIPELDADTFALIETHSEHLLLRVLRRVRESHRAGQAADPWIRAEDVAIYYISHKDGATKAARVQIDPKGEFRVPWPDDQFEIDFQERLA